MHKPTTFRPLLIASLLSLCGTGYANTEIQPKSSNSGVTHVVTNVPYQVPHEHTYQLNDTMQTPAIAKVASAVADWQLAQFDIRSNKMRGEIRPSGIPNGWMYATFHIGLWHWASVSDSLDYKQTVMNLSQLNDYQLGPRVYHADDHAVGDVYLSIFNEFGDKKRIENTIAHFNTVVEQPSDRDFLFEVKQKDVHKFDLRTFTDPWCTTRWCWADAVFMSPPVMAHLSKTTGDTRYLEFMDKEFWAMTDYLFDPEYQLYLRDSRYFNRKDPQGRRIFWGRGNGWVLAGLARTIAYMPEDFSNKSKYIDLFKNMSKALLSYQLEDGSWPSSLLEKNADTHSETSATALLAYALAWGIKHEVLEDAVYRPALNKAWASIVANIHENGKVGFVQQVAFAPGSATKDDTQLYGSGAVLLAAAEITALLAQDKSDVE